jgi:oxygen-independent coproporphyrinogen-3 oxidase
MILEQRREVVHFSLYLHVPFCVSKCGYCSFYSRPADDASVEAWLAALGRETELIGAIWEGRPPLRTLYVGGGTPTVLPLSVWKRLLRILENSFDLSALEEATVEANPCSLTNDHLSLWRNSFVTRVSLGVQSLQDIELTWLQRRHDANTALRALDIAVRRGFDVSADLIFGLPMQTLRTWRDSLRRVLASGVKHISIYQLTLEPHTPLGQINPALPDGYAFYRFAQWYLARKGLEQYEIASFAARDNECRHNLAYWIQGNVLALGPSAWGYLDGFRYRNAASIEEYVSMTDTRLPPVEAERLEGRSRGVEAAILALRTRQGVDLTSFAARFGRELADEVTDVLEKIPRRLVSFEDDAASESPRRRVRLTPSGMRVGNAIWVELLELAD